MSLLSFLGVGEFMFGRLLGIASGAVLAGLLVTGCGSAPGGGDPDEVAPTPELGQEQEEGAEGGVTDAEVIVVSDDGAEIHEDCADREVVVTADDAVVVLDGDCGLVKATGRNSVVEVGTAVKIVLVGVDNQVSFASGEPEVVNHGRNTTVSEGGTAQY
ncbi:DUF3060 domain-containing protein [Nocardiopsis ganjiahuensis]|uniref:DUF3060 domain-containing protein n=1 Tax=Nocardiopsis ganjiahuensis TaxID=239984 RepID=UPI001EF9CAB6|nr:DUF3060 domain-containing protein [Nocardiopsis ganjiahuensis]